MLARMLLLAGAASSLVAQAPAFDVASIKPLSPGAPPARWEAGHGVLRAGTTPRWLIQFAYGVPSPLLEGAPAWTGQEFFDVNARGDPSAGEAQIARMLQSLLAARFQLRVHRENQTRSGYHLAVEQSAKLPKSSPDGVERDGAGSISIGRNGLTAHGASMQSLSEFLWEGVLQAPVLNQTGLDGIYDFNIPWDRQDPSSIFASLRGIGLNLKKSQVQLEILRVDHIERPSGN